jgi:hypothetical protein
MDFLPERRLRLRFVKPFGQQGRGESGLARPAESDTQPADDLSFHRFVAALQGHVVTFLGSQKK